MSERSRGRETGTESDHPIPGVPQSTAQTQSADDVLFRVDERYSLLHVTHGFITILLDERRAHQLVHLGGGIQQFEFLHAKTEENHRNTHTHTGK
jgi:hypothetical protein